MNRVLAIFSLLVLALLSLLVFLVARPQAAPDAMRPVLSWLDQIGTSSNSTRPPSERSGSIERPAMTADGATSTRPPIVDASNRVVPVDVSDERSRIAAVVADEATRVAQAGPVSEGAAAKDPASIATNASSASTAVSSSNGGEASFQPGGANRLAGSNPLAGASAALADSLTRTPATRDGSQTTGARSSGYDKPDPGPSRQAYAPDNGRTGDDAAVASSPIDIGAASETSAVGRSRAAIADRAMLLPPDAPAPRAPVTPAARAQQASIANFLADESVEFEIGRDVLTPVGRSTLEQIRRLVEQNRATTIIIQGHTDDVGDDASNLELSSARALRARSYLIAQGVPPERLRAQGFGERSPIASNATNEGRKRNRRIDFAVVER